MFVTLFFLKKALKDSVKNYNNTMHEIMGDVRASVGKYSEYLGYFFNARRGLAVMNYSGQNYVKTSGRHTEKRAYLDENYGEFLSNAT